MALATQCPHCNTTFRVAPDQLKLRGGIVRCGFCNDIFDGAAALLALPALLPAAVNHGRAGNSVADDRPPNFDQATPQPAGTDGAPVEHYLDADAARFAADSEIHFNLGETDVSIRDDVSSRSEQAVSRLTAIKNIVTEPAFIQQGRRRGGKRMRMAWAGAIVLLLLALLTQSVLTWRNQLAAQVPALQSALATLCKVAGCHLELPAQIESVTIEQGELQTLTEFTFSFATVLHNQASTAQTWPNMELILNDASDQPVLRRVLAPRDYLAISEPAKIIAAGFPAHAEQAVTFHFELARLHASNYHIAVFYP